jgi:hypothetical protein
MQKISTSLDLQQTIAIRHLLRSRNITQYRKLVEIRSSHLKIIQPELSWALPGGNRLVRFIDSERVHVEPAQASNHNVELIPVRKDTLRH